MQLRFTYPVFISALILSASVAFGQTGVMTTVAGTGNAGGTGDGGPATLAELNRPSGVTLDVAGNVYITDSANNRIREVSASTGFISTVAGSTSERPYGGDGGPAISAFLNHPEDVAVDKAGNLYIADSFNNRIRKVTAATGRISTIAGTDGQGFNGDGGPATLAELNDPSGVAVDSAGNVYIADQSNHRIRKIDVATGLISTVAGTGTGGFSGEGGAAISSQLNFPTHIAIDSAGNIYIADSQNYRVRKISVATGIISTIAGTGDPGFSGDGGPATAAMLSFPYQVAADDAGDVFVTDTGVKRVRYINAKTAQIDTVAGGGINTDNCSALTSSLQFPIAVGLNASASRLYIADIADNRIRMVTLTDTVSKPVLASISPSSGLRNADYAVTLNGSGFLTPSSANCMQGVTTLSISGSGISVSNMNVSSDSSLTATLAVAADALFGTYNITVTTEKGTSNPIRFTVIEPAPTLTFITPPSAPRGSTTVITITGTAFDLSPGATRLVVDGNAIVANNVRIISPTSIAASFTINDSAALTSYSVGIVTPGGTSNVLMFSVDPQPLTIVDPMPQILNPTDQTPLRLQLANPSPDPITGRLTVTFLPNAANNADDPGVSLVNEQASTRTVDFVFPPNNNEAQFSLAGISLDAGTVAGTIRLTISGTQESGKNVALSPSIFDVTVPRLVPLITDARILNRTPSGFDVQITGYSDSKEITAASFQFGRASGTNLQTSTLQVNLKEAFTAYYQSADVSSAGGTFVYRQPFMVQGDVNAIESVTVRLSNTQGDSAPSIAR